MEREDRGENERFLIGRKRSLFPWSSQILPARPSDSVIIVKTLKIWISSEVISRQYGSINCEMCDLERSFELAQNWDFNFGDMEIASSFQKTFH